MPLTTGEIAAASCLIEFTVAGGSWFAPERRKGLRQRAEHYLSIELYCRTSSHAGIALNTEGDL